MVADTTTPCLAPQSAAFGSRVPHQCLAGVRVIRCAKTPSALLPEMVMLNVSTTRTVMTFGSACRSQITLAEVSSGQLAHERAARIRRIPSAGVMVVTAGSPRGSPRRRATAVSRATSTTGSGCEPSTARRDRDAGDQDVLPSHRAAVDGELEAAGDECIDSTELGGTLFARRGRCRGPVHRCPVNACWRGRERCKRERSPPRPLDSVDRRSALLSGQVDGRATQIGGHRPAASRRCPRGLARCGQDPTPVAADTRRRSETSRPGPRLVLLEKDGVDSQ